jgi:chemotaxis-related protein WspD
MSDAAASRPHAIVPPQPECWRTIGISGDKSCPELVTFIHCRNCPVLAEAARTFFDRTPPAGYLDAWREILEEPAAAAETESTSVLVFRLGTEWFALPAAALVEVTTPRPLHRIPHRAGGGLAGLVNIRGQLQLCMSLHALLGLSGGPQAAAATATESAARFLVVERMGDAGVERWVLGVDEVAGVHRVTRSAIRAVPSTVSQAQARCSTALFEWQERTVGLLDDGRVFAGLRGMVSA